MRVWLSMLVAAASLGAALSAQSSRPLPDPDPFFAATRANAARAQAMQGAFAYKERRTELHLNPFGRLGTDDDTVAFDVTPLPGGGTERRLIERNGRPVDGAPVERRGARRPRGSRRPSAIEDVVAVLRFTVKGREIREGRELIVVAFAARPEARPRTREGQIAARFTGVMYVDEAVHEVTRVEAVAAQDLTFGFGLVARLGAGTRVVATRTEVEPGLWLPASLRISGQGRALLVRRLRIDQTIEWFDYRRVLP